MFFNFDLPDNSLSDVLVNYPKLTRLLINISSKWENIIHRSKYNLEISFKEINSEISKGISTNCIIFELVMKVDGYFLEAKVMRENFNFIPRNHNRQFSLEYYRAEINDNGYIIYGGDYDSGGEYCQFIHKRTIDGANNVLQNEISQHQTIYVDCMIAYKIYQKRQIGQQTVNYAITKTKQYFMNNCQRFNSYNDTVTLNFYLVMNAQLLKICIPNDIMVGITLVKTRYVFNNVTYSMDQINMSKDEIDMAYEKYIVDTLVSRTYLYNTILTSIDEMKLLV